MCVHHGLFRLQKYKKFESNSQRKTLNKQRFSRCFDCKSTKNLRAIHNETLPLPLTLPVVSTAKVQKIWEQFTTRRYLYCWHYPLFRLQKYKKFESNSQLITCVRPSFLSCFDCKSTKNLRAIHNKKCPRIINTWLFRLQKYKKFESNSQRSLSNWQSTSVVSTAKVQKIWEQFTTAVTH